MASLILFGGWWRSSASRRWCGWRRGVVWGGGRGRVGGWLWGGGVRWWRGGVLVWGGRWVVGWGGWGWVCGGGRWGGGVGGKVMNRNLSDCAAMACLPAVAVCAAGLPKGVGVEFAKELYLGMKEAGENFACEIVGGD